MPRPMSRNVRNSLITGIVLATLGVVGGTLGTVIGMMRSFSTLGASGMSNPSALSEDIGNVLVFSVIGTGLAGIGIILIFGSLIIWLSSPQKPPSTALD